ncbi:cytochrome P450 [Actinosynnema sp. CS-041913]|uniref:cytochrome P450 n=1 Tax=Actinosynnema sp. CS-041913 TaxID=3239917 RepID=UPI003D8E6C6E
MTTLNEIRFIAETKANQALGRWFSLVGRLDGGDPYPLYERMREKGPLYREHTGQWVATSHATVNSVLRDRRFGTRLTNGELPGMTPSAREATGVFHDSFLEQDPPDHTRLRRLVAPAFSPRRVAGYRARVERLADELLAKDEFDLIGDFAAPVPIAVISDLLGIPDEDTAGFAEYGRLVGATADGATSLTQARALRRAVGELDAIFGRLIARRRADPGDDVISALVQAETERKLTAEELTATCGLLLIAGFETTVNLIGNGTAALLADPEQFALLRENPDLAPDAVEETLRHDPPVQLTSRVARQEVELHGHRLRPDQNVYLVIGAANRDPDVYPDPGRFDLTRDHRPEHLAFSSGIHFCLGATLARMEGDVAFRALARLPRLRPAGRAVHRGSTVIRGFASFPVSRS